MDLSKHISRYTISQTYVQTMSLLLSNTKNMGHREINSIFPLNGTPVRTVIIKAIADVNETAKSAKQLEVQ